MSQHKDVIVACDFADKATTINFLEKFTTHKPFVKIGMELFYGEGPDIVREIKSRGHKIFLDLKLHDIPNTVQRAMRNLARLGVDMTNLHAAGGSAMMQAALQGLEEGATGQRATLIAVTQLTSTSQEMMNKELLIGGNIQNVVESYAANAKASGLNGVVCSPLEAGLVKAACGAGFLTITPGIRYPDGEIGDQSRVTTPADAAKIGSDYIVVGRPITAAEDPVAAYGRVLKDFLG
ncbi:orotidine-5'-phosphate decarboxylase [Ruminococcaceae bacterium OttesenSCG-928-A16]|nr:orotidine-5'-phosphate decarboxylase [Ruminococcaceae bacterium OttesenSCG-928-A16]